MKKLSKVTALVSVTAMALGLAACSGGGAAGESADHSAEMFTWVSTANDRAQWQAFVDAAKEKNPDFTLTFDGPAFNDYWTKVKTRMTDPDAPCILTTQAARAQELKGILSPLDDLIKANNVDVSQYNAAMMEGMTVDGSIVALPYDAEPDVLFYNKAMFKAAGLEEPGLKYTTDQFLSDAKALTKDGKFGVAIKSGFMDNAPGTLAFSFGGTVTKGEGLGITDKEFVDGVQFAFDLVNVHKVAAAPSAADGDDVAQGAFNAGTAAMIFDGPWMYGAFEKELGENLGVAVIPNPSGDTIGVIQGSGFGIAQSCQNKEEAFKVLMQMVTPEVIGAVAEKQGTVPSIESQIEKWAANKPEGNVAAIQELLKKGTPFVSNSAWNQVSTSFVQYAPEGYRGTQTAMDMLTSIAGSAQ